MKAMLAMMLDLSLLADRLGKNLANLLLLIDFSDKMSYINDKLS